MAVECVHGAHRAIEEQESRDEALYLAYAGLKAAVDDFSSDDGEDDGQV